MIKTFLLLSLILPFSSFAFTQGYEATEYEVGYYCPTGSTHNGLPVWQNGVNFLYNAYYGPHAYWVIGSSALNDTYGSDWYSFNNTLNNSDPIVQSTWSNIPSSTNSAGSILLSYDCDTPSPPSPSTDDNYQSMYLFITKYLVEIAVSITFTALLMGVAFKNIQK